MNDMKLALKRTDTAGAGVPAPNNGTPPKKRRRFPVKRLIALVLVLAIAGGGAWYFLRGGQNTASAAGSAYTTAEVTRRSITSTITGSGTLEAADSYSVTTLLEGTILTAGFEEGDQVEAGTVLYTIDDSDAATTLEQAQISLNQSERSYQNTVESLEDLTVTAASDGRILSLDVEAGDEVTAGQQVATIRDSDTMTLTVPFPADDAAGFYVGQSAEVTLDSTFETLAGTVSEIAGNTEVLTGNRIVRQVTIEVANPGGLSTTQTATAAINGVGSSSGGTFEYEEEVAVTAKVSGTVASIPVPEGEQVSLDQSLVVLTSDTLSEQVESAEDSLRNAEISYETQTEQLDDYTITAPITGTIVDKNYNAGEITEANEVLCTIYDLSYLTMTLSVDELDIADIEVGQTVTIVADAVEDKTYEGVVTKVSVAGTSSGSATTYPVTIRIDETDGLLPGMSVDATITLSSAEDVLAIPSAALNRGDTVLVTADSPSAANAAQTGDSGETASPSDGDDGQEYVMVSVTTGISDDNYIEITSGLQEGDTVVYIPTTSSDSGMGMMGGMPGGSMPGGGGMGGGPGGF